MEGLDPVPDRNMISFESNLIVYLLPFLKKDL
jgi:hypothetical protein